MSIPRTQAISTRVVTARRLITGVFIADNAGDQVVGTKCCGSAVCLVRGVSLHFKLDNVGADAMSHVDHIHRQGCVLAERCRGCPSTR